MKKIIYLYKSGTLQRKDDSLVFILKDDTKEYIPIIQVDSIFVFSDITFNKRVLGLLNQYNVCLFFFNYYGNYIGRFSPKKYSDGKIIVEQVKAFEDDRRMVISKSITSAEINNCLSFIKYYDKKYHCFNDVINEIENIFDCIQNIDSVNQLLLLEAQAKKLYYSCFDRIILNSEFRFEKRTMNPPKNEMNALLSYGYSMLYSVILSDIDKSALLPNISFIHSLSKQSDSLQFDLADIYKPILIDRLVIRMVNKRQLDKSFFIYHDDGSVYLDKKCIKLYLEEFEKELTKSIKRGNKYYSYRNLLTRDVYNLANYIKGKEKTYKPYVMRW